MVKSNGEQNNERKVEMRKEVSQLLRGVCLLAVVVFALVISFKYAIVSTEYRMYKQMVNTCSSNNADIPQLPPLEIVKPIKK